VTATVGQAVAILLPRRELSVLPGADQGMEQAPGGIIAECPGDFVGIRRCRFRLKPPVVPG
jgi:hypothetical protein